MTAILHCETNCLSVAILVTPELFLRLKFLKYLVLSRIALAFPHRNFFLAPVHLLSKFTGKWTGAPGGKPPALRQSTDSRPIGRPTVGRLSTDRGWSTHDPFELMSVRVSARTWISLLSIHSHPHLYKVVVGEHDRNVLEKTEQYIKVKKLVVHPQYGKPVRANNDIALIQLARPATLNSRVQTVCLPSHDYDVPTSSRCFITGKPATVIRFITSDVVRWFYFIQINGSTSWEFAIHQVGVRSSTQATLTTFCSKRRCRRSPKTCAPRSWSLQVSIYFQMQYTGKLVRIFCVPWTLKGNDRGEIGLVQRYTDSGAVRPWSYVYSFQYQEVRRER